MNIQHLLRHQSLHPKVNEGKSVTSVLTFFDLLRLTDHLFLRVRAAKQRRNVDCTR